MRKIKGFASERKMLLLRVMAVLVPLAVTVLLLSQIVSAETTYVITDGSRVLVHTTSETDPEMVLGEAGLALGTDDSFTTQTDDGISQINVRRSQRVLIDYYGEQMAVTSQGETVEELLTRLNLTWSDADSISLPLDARTCEGMELTVAQVIHQNQVYASVLPHAITYSTDGTLPEGTEKVITEGVDGEILCEAVVTYINGVETARKILSQQVVTQPVEEIVAVGAGHIEQRDERLPVIGERTITLATGEVLTYTEKVTCIATAYHCEGYVGKTATGTRARVGAIAVDPEVFPYGTRFFILTKDGEYIYGIATAEDCGDKRFIYGTRLDLFFDTKAECIQFGARSCDVYILG